MSLQEIDAMVRDKIPKCPACGEPFGQIKCSPHKLGIDVEGMPGKQRVVFPCAKCNRDWPLWMLKREIEKM